MGIFGDRIEFTAEEEAVLDALSDELAPQFAKGPAPHPDVPPRAVRWRFWLWRRWQRWHALARRTRGKH